MGKDALIVVVVCLGLGLQVAGLVANFFPGVVMSLSSHDLLEVARFLESDSSHTIEDALVAIEQGPDLYGEPRHDPAEVAAQLRLELGLVVDR